jgi:purine-nucleoside phosphorylase
MTHAPETDPAAAAARAAAVIAERTGVAGHDVAVVLGSGWGTAADVVGDPRAEVALADLPGFVAPAAAGHGGTLRSVRQGGNECLLFLGRTHLYEGRGVDAVAHTVRTAAAAGCSRVVLTNGCGGLNPAWAPGTVVLISDHLNLTATSPLRGARFVDLTDLYSPRMRRIAHDVDPDLPEGVYAQLPGPHYETPAEIRMLATLGADLVGMSTTLEAIASRAAGLEVLGLSLVTNAAAGLSGDPLDHAEVLESGQQAAGRLGALLRDILGKV